VYLQDPSGVVQVALDEYVVYSSHEGIQAHTSSDRVSWSLSKTPAFPDGVKWVADYSRDKNPHEMMSPDVQFVPDRTPAGGTYWMYFCASAGSGSRHSAIGAFMIKKYQRIKIII
jgi:beta-xylosidase